jgi:hypothetical protein
MLPHYNVLVVKLSSIDLVLGPYLIRIRSTNLGRRLEPAQGNDSFCCVHTIAQGSTVDACSCSRPFHSLGSHPSIRALNAQLPKTIAVHLSYIQCRPLLFPNASCNNLRQSCFFSKNSVPRLYPGWLLCIFKQIHTDDKPQNQSLSSVRLRPASAHHSSGISSRSASPRTIRCHPDNSSSPDVPLFPDVAEPSRWPRDKEPLVGGAKNPKGDDPDRWLGWVDTAAASRKRML